MNSSESTARQNDTFTITRRYLPHLTDYDAQYEEAEFRPIERRLSFASSKCALILLDVWNKNEIGFERFDLIARQRIKPVVDAFRAAGMLVIHAPSPPVANKYPERRFKPSCPEEWLFHRPSDGWPTREMIFRTGEYSDYSLNLDNPAQPATRAEEQLYKNYFIHPSVGPVGDDVVVGDRNELHSLLKERQKFHLFYAGFASNGCMQERDYGIKWVAYLGYDITLIRDCTAALEMSHTVGTLEQTRASVDNMELWISTCDSTDLITGLDRMRLSPNP